MKPELPAEELSFTDEKGARRPKIIAGIVAGGMIAWMGSGYVFPSEKIAEALPERPAVLTSVGFQMLEKQPVSRIFFAEGETMPNRMTGVRSPGSGEIVNIFVNKGETVEKGQLIAQIDPVELEFQLARAQKEFDKANQELINADTLFGKGVITKDRHRALGAALAASRSELTRATKALADSKITAPYGGLVEALDIEKGEYITAGTEIGSVLETSPLKIAFNVPQSVRGKIKVGQMAEIHFANGATGRAKVTFIGSLGSSETRTFKAEAIFQNTEAQVPAGMSASVAIPYAEEEGHFISPSIIATNAEGTLGVKTIKSEEDVIVFTPIEIIRSQKDGVWVSGIQDESRVVTIGQGYVSAGERVSPKPDNR